MPCKILKYLIIGILLLVFYTTTSQSSESFERSDDYEINNSRIIRSLYNSNKQFVYGKPKIGRGTLIGGTNIIRGSFPWLVAIVTVHGKFFCGGSLISSTKVVSAAHCILQKNEKVPLLPRDLKVLLGVHDLNDSLEVGRVIAVVKTIHIHPDWNPFATTFDADISVLELEKEVQFSDYIIPICLIEPHSEMTKIDQGVIVGYGKSEDDRKVHENIPKSLKSPIIYHRNCSESHTDLASLLSNRAFCGGDANGTGTCTGDSGSGLFIEYAGKFYLRGIVSSSLMNVNNDCNVAIHSVLTDVLNFNDWITFDTLQIRNTSSWSKSRLNALQHEITQSLSASDVDEMIKTLQGILAQKQNSSQFTTSDFVERVTQDSKCNLPVDSGTCDEYVINYNYDSSSQSCKAFYYGGCGGNANRFETRLECETACVTKSTDVEATEKLNSIDDRNSTQISTDCTDNNNFANCELIVKAKYCNHKHFAKYCCQSCTIAGQIPMKQPSD